LQNKLGGAGVFELFSRVTDLENDILQALRNLERAVESIRATGAKPDLLPLFSRVDALTRQLPKDADPELLHFLHKKSYEKAQAWLQSRH
jgi:hypothetical protein